MHPAPLSDTRASEQSNHNEIEEQADFEAQIDEEKAECEAQKAEEKTDREA